MGLQELEIDFDPIWDVVVYAVSTQIQNQVWLKTYTKVNEEMWCNLIGSTRLLLDDYLMDLYNVA